ncbi:beta strand repeat-containing protein [Sphingomonas sp. LT1P40]|uniref:beta strand repeat-containing protein n=1 Tax=Alteristakelama amylovorans TaxID=3096166 RepID=UPI002FCA4520
MAVITGTSGNDYIQGTEGDDTISGGEGDDVIFANGGADKVKGDGGNDYIVGGVGDDDLDGGDGDDEISGLEGNDIIAGGDGIDKLHGRQGNDVISGGAGADEINGDGFVSSVDDGADHLSGGEGDDRISGHGADDTLYGDGGNDTLRGGHGSDILDGGDGDDRLSGYGEEGYGVDSSIDALSGGAGNDWLTVGYGDSADGGVGSDTIYLDFYSGSAGVSADLRQLANNGSIQIGGGTITNVELVAGISLTAFDDVIVAGPIAPGVVGISISGWGGNDHLTESAGTDTIYGGDGDDVIIGGTGYNAAVYPSTDRLMGESGNDTIYVRDDGALVSGGSGDDTVYGGAGADEISGDSGQDQLFGGGGNDGISGGDGDDRIEGGDGNDTLVGNRGKDDLSGGDGDDTIFAGNNQVDDNETDRIFAGAGADTIWASAGDTIDGGTGLDTLHLSARLTQAISADFTAGSVTIAGGSISGIEAIPQLLLSDADDWLVLGFNGAAGGSQIDAAGGNDFVVGTAGSDRLSGGTGDDALDGGAGNDTLLGGEGNDLLIAGIGADMLRGGAGNDRYWVSDARAQIVEADGDGSDELVLGVSYVLGAGISIEFVNLSLRPASQTSNDNAIDFTGNSFVQRIDATDGVNVIRGGSGGNVIRGFGGNDSLYGEGGFDELLGGLGDDMLDGGDGEDMLDGGAGADQLRGGAGVDTFVYRLVTDSTVAASDRLLDFQNGIDRIDLTAFRVGVITLVNSGAFATATIETDQGTMQLTSDTAFALSDFVLGERAFTGSAGADSLAGGGMNDSFDMSQGGDDSVSGGDGNDAFFFGAALTAADTVDGGAGTNDQLGLQGNYTGANALTLGANTIGGIELIGLLGGAGNGYAITTVDANVAGGQVLTVFGTNLAAGNAFTFNGSAETDGSFRIYGGAGTDNFTGGAQNDGFWFGPGRFDPSVDRVNGGGGNNDQLALDGDYTITLDGAAIQGIETITLQAGPASDRNSFDITVADSFVGAGQQVTIFGLLAVNAIRIDASAELDGSVRVFGGQSHDTIIGSAGDDRLFGGAGSDSLIGGAGNDVYVYDAVSQSTGLYGDGIQLLDGDKIDFNFTVAGVATTVVGGTLGGDFDADLAAAIGAGQMGVGEAVLFRPDAGIYAGTSFLIVDANGVAGYQAGQDYVIGLIGNPTDLPPDPFV